MSWDDDVHEPLAQATGRKECGAKPGLSDYWLSRR